MQAEIIEAEEIHVGYNAMDYQAYPDCRPEYLEAFQQLANISTKQAIEGKAPRIIAPLLKMTKTEIFAEAKKLDVPIHLTFSCYDPTPNDLACQRCDACILRKCL